MFSMTVAVLAIGLPCLGVWMRRQQAPQCALDGVPIDAIYAVEIAGPSGNHHRFCCIRCAEYWRAQNNSLDETVHVTDEVSGRAIPAEEAYFVRSSVITNPITLNRIHAFAEGEDAEAHARQFSGRLLEGDARPLQANHANLEG
ncbi:MAG TPA: hypothetical protein VNH11_03160 [Pirellulales bacterium]|nr:hypothetical protein [Pirellulales bacterium]